MPKYNIFYSWQMDIPVENNKRPIELSIQEACINIAKTNIDFEYIIDDATRDIPGSPSIPDSIFSKINASDIFIADITTVSHECDGKNFSNPNVLIELGFAISCIGWSRIILLYNKQFGKFPDDIAFDIAKNRILDFKIKDKYDKSGYGMLLNQLVVAIKLIYEKNPKKPNEILFIDDGKRKRANDINKIRELCNSLEYNTIDYFIKEFHNKFYDSIFFYFEEFKAKMENPYFYVYDGKIKLLLNNFLTLWKKSLSFGHKYRYTGKDVFLFCMEDSRSPDDSTILERIAKVQMELQNAFNELLTEIREKWLEIDLDECSKTAKTNYIEFHKRKIEFL